MRTSVPFLALEPTELLFYPAPKGAATIHQTISPLWGLPASLVQAAVGTAPKGLVSSPGFSAPKGLLTWSVAMVRPK